MSECSCLSPSLRTQAERPQGSSWCDLVPCGTAGTEPAVLNQGLQLKKPWEPSLLTGLVFAVLSDPERFRELKE